MCEDNEYLQAKIKEQQQEINELKKKLADIENNLPDFINYLLRDPDTYLVQHVIGGTIIPEYHAELKRFLRKF